MHPRRRAACVVLGIDLDLNTGRARGVRGHPQWAREVCKVSRTPHGKPNACHCTREADHEVETRGIAWAPAEAKSVPIHRTGRAREHSRGTGAAPRRALLSTKVHACKRLDCPRFVLVKEVVSGRADPRFRTFFCTCALFTTVPAKLPVRIFTLGSWTEVKDA